MRFLPPRRWFQFRLSTWFVLVAILGWAMATRPYTIPAAGSDVMLHDSFITDSSGQVLLSWNSDRELNPALRWPTLALAAFVAWKAARTIGPRLVRRSKSAAPE